MVSSDLPALQDQEERGIVGASIDGPHLGPTSCWPVLGEVAGVLGQEGAPKGGQVHSWSFKGKANKLCITWVDVKKVRKHFEQVQQAFYLIQS